MDTNKRIMAASAAAVLGLLMAGCDNTETEDADTGGTTEAPAGTTEPTTVETGMGDDATTDTGAEGTVPEGDAGDAGGAGTGADTDAEAGTDN